jgi:hypothetical protein
VSIPDWVDLGIEKTLRGWHGAITAKDLSLLLKLALSTTYRYAQKGILPRLALRGVVRFDPNAVADSLFGGGK